MLINLYDNLGVATPNGQWTYSGNLNPHPNPPNPYNETIDFTGFAFGDYSYTYTVQDVNCESLNTLTVTYGEQIEVINNECSGAINLPLNGIIITNQTTLTACPGNLVTLSPEVSNFTDVSSDVWFKSNTPTSSSYLQVNIFPQNIPIGNNENGTIFISIYSGSCGNITLIEEGSFSLTTNNYSYFSTNAFSNQQLIYRIYSKTNKEGDFNINLLFDDA